MLVGTPGFFIDIDKKMWELLVGTPGFQLLMRKDIDNACRHTSISADGYKNTWEMLAYNFTTKLGFTFLPPSSFFGMMMRFLF